MDWNQLVLVAIPVMASAIGWLIVRLMDLTSRVLVLESTATAQSARISDLKSDLKTINEKLDRLIERGDH